MFDPYHKWLGISPKDQPPNHYRLLGIDLFESDIDVISHAADQRMSHIKAFSLKYRNESQKILNEIAKARVVLSNPVAKQSYDETLRSVCVAASGLPPPGPVKWKNWSGLGIIRQQNPDDIKIEVLKPLIPLTTEDVLTQNVQPVQTLPSVLHKPPSKIWPYCVVVWSILVAPFVVLRNIAQGVQDTIEKPRPQSPWMTLLALLGLGFVVLIGVCYLWPDPVHLNPSVREEVFVGLKANQSELEIFGILGRPTKITHGTRYKFSRMGAADNSYLLAEDETFSSYLYIYKGENQSEEIRILLSSDDKLLSAVYLYKGYPLGYTGIRDDKCPSVTQNSFNIAREDMDTRARKLQLENFFAQYGVKN